MEEKRRNYAEARKRFEEALRHSPHDVSALRSLGQMALERGHWKEARSCFEKALSLETDDFLIFILHDMGTLWSEMGDNEAALRCFAEVLRRDPEDLEALVARAVLEGKRGSFQEAQRGFEQVWERISEDMAWWESRKRGLRRERRLRGLEEENLDVAVAWGKMEIRRKEFQRARELLEGIRGRLRKSGRWDKEPPALLNALARLEAAESDHDPGEAHRWRQCFEQSLEADPKDVITYNGWAQAEVRAGNLDKAEELFRKALDCDPDNAYTHRAYGETLLGMTGREKEGRNYLSRARELGMEKLGPGAE